MFRYTIEKHKMSEIEAGIYFGDTNPRVNDPVLTISVSRFHANGEKGLKIAAKAACDALNMKLKNEN